MKTLMKGLKNNMTRSDQTSKKLKIKTKHNNSSRDHFISEINVTTCYSSLQNPYVYHSPFCNRYEDESGSLGGGSTGSGSGFPPTSQSGTGGSGGSGYPSLGFGPGHGMMGPNFATIRTPNIISRQHKVSLKLKGEKYFNQF